jgi:hypothetical protein
MAYRFEHDSGRSGRGARVEEAVVFQDESGFSGRTVSPWQFKACTFWGKSLALPMFFVAQMKTKQIPDDFRDWIEARTFEIGAPIVLPPRLPLDYLKRTIIRQPAPVLPTAEIRH